jgi:hypothetical protein
MNYPESVPPRSLSLLSRLIILFGGFFVQFGWTFFIMGSFFFWVFFFASGGGDYLISWSWEGTKGQVIRVEKPGPDDAYTSDQLTIRYTVAGKVYEETEYASDGQYQVGDEVAMSYVPQNPATMRLDQPRDHSAGFAPWVSAIFPLFGLGMIYFGMRNNLKSLELVLYGRLTSGHFVSKSATGSTINKIPVYRYTFSFEGDDGQQYEVSGATHQYHLLEGERNERILYAPNDPGYAQLYDLIPYAPTMARDGSLDPIPFYYAVVLIQPAFGIWVYGSVLLGRFF